MTGRHKLALFRQGDPAFIGVLALVAVVMISALGAAAMMVDGTSVGSRVPAAAGAPDPVTPASPLPETSSSPSAAQSPAPEAASSPSMLPVSMPARPPTLITNPTPSAVPPTPALRVYEAESPNNTLTGGAAVAACAACSAGADVRGIGLAGVLQFTGVAAGRTGSAPLTISYVNGDLGNRLALLGVGNTYATWVTFPSTRNGPAVGTVTVTVPLQAGTNSVAFMNNFAPGPDVDRIAVRDPGT